MPKPIAVARRDWWLVTSSCGTYPTPGDGLTAGAVVRGTALWGTQWGQLDGGLVACSLAPLPDLLGARTPSVNCSAG
jgi:hypothetical protein